MPEPDPLEIVVAGAGPRALFALEALASRLGERSPRITVIDPGTSPGTGSAYSPDQPDELRLNVDSAILEPPATGDVPSFRDGEPADADPYPARAAVGRYLSGRWENLAERLPLTVLRDQVLDVEPLAGGGWRIGREGGEPLAAGEVLLVTGHARDHEDALWRTWTGALPLIPAVLPVAEHLSTERVPPGRDIAVRGAALTFLDAALALTEGRGGRFLLEADGRTLRHERHPEEPAVIRPTSRHGLLLDAKPDPGTVLPSALLSEIEGALPRLRSAQGVREVLDVVIDVSAHALSRLDQDAEPTFRDQREAVLSTLTTGAEPDLPAGPGRAQEALRRSVEVADGLRSPGPAWVLGRTWSRLYPQITQALRGSDAPQADWEEFLAAARALERFAFGPPLRGARRLLAMIASGAVDLSWLDTGVRIAADGIHGAPPGAARDLVPPDLVLDAVLAPPGLRGVADPLPRALMHRGLAQVRPGRRGARTAPDGTLLDAGGGRHEGLALIGRAAEDDVIGHDTLSRRLHGETERWADRLASRLDSPSDLEGSSA